MSRRSPLMGKLVWLVAAVATLSAAGCAPGVQWRYDFASAYDQSKAKGWLTLVYFRQWFLPQCGRIEEKVFGLPELREATRDVTCVRYELYAGDPLSSAWNVTAAPAFVIVDIRGNILARRTGDFSVKDVLDALDAARKAAGGGASQPGKP